MPILLNLDYLLTNLFSKIIPHNIFFDYLFSFFSLKGSSIFIWILVIVLVVILEERKNPGITKQDKRFIIFFSASFLLTFLLSDFVLKNIFQRIRPFLDTKYLILNTFICPNDFSFPSAHAATAFAAAGVLTYFDKKRSWFYYLVAILISYSRIYLGCHYFFDVIIGTVIGYLISKLFLRLISKFNY
ncbi:MAG: phosphatase PAP2 family protein [Candidatus Roizmanbacteria bacterium]|nr:phosphatase PAP2 family protein [Candidatus Roizmanbacteria bacterium]MCR4312790.1 phosphatase PAP2 family protein [Candidatus Roizmanbacteria bacterium]